MEPRDKKDEKPTGALPDTLKESKSDSDVSTPETQPEHRVSSSKPLNLTDEDKALDSGI
jgi:hypothetical protein